MSDNDMSLTDAVIATVTRRNPGKVDLRRGTAEAGATIVCIRQAGNEVPPGPSVPRICETCHSDLWLSNRVAAEVADLDDIHFMCADCYRSAEGPVLRGFVTDGAALALVEAMTEVKE